MERLELYCTLLAGCKFKAADSGGNYDWNEDLLHLGRLLIQPADWLSQLAIGLQEAANMCIQKHINYLVKNYEDNDQTKSMLF